MLWLTRLRLNNKNYSCRVNERVTVTIFNRFWTQYVRVETKNSKTRKMQIAFDNRNKFNTFVGAKNKM